MWLLPYLIFHLATLIQSTKLSKGDVDMKKETLIAMRDTLTKNNDDPDIVIMCDNMLFFKTKYDVFKWDDDNELLIVLRANEDYTHEDNAEFEVVCIDYEQIQFLHYRCGRAAVKRIANELNFTDKAKEQLSDMITELTTITL
jgi:hypothetical protein